ncbi:uncharacterized protein [Cherax quadricarinatus]|uniref:uncharacterized protein n=1 Tax=Cherax quadricarinatus TaxID=27406 RepID=UPI00387ED6DA
MMMRGAWWISLVASFFLLVTYINLTSYNPSGYTILEQLPQTQTPHTNSRNETHLPWWDGGHCRCKGKVCVPEEAALKVSMKGVGGTCGRRSWTAGGKQRVVSLYLDSDMQDYYWMGLEQIIRENIVFTSKMSNSLTHHLQVGLMFPGWVVRLYVEPHTHAAHLCPLLRLYAHFHVCDITNLPPPLGNISGVHPTMWRIAPLGDPQVTALMVRDTDSQVSEREQAAVEEWLASSKSFHVMRDHPNHDKEISASLWGARWDQPPRYQRKNAQFLTVVRDVMLKDAADKINYGKDQMILANIFIEELLIKFIVQKRLWPLMMGRVLAHDSYNCLMFLGSSSWPTQRVNGFYVGSPRNLPANGDKTPCVKAICCRAHGVSIRTDQLTWLVPRSLAHSALTLRSGVHISGTAG